MGGGTEAFPDLGKHCEYSECKQLDFLPFKCQACHKDFCLDHRTYKSHKCPKPDHGSRRVVVCETCSAAVEITGCSGEDEERRLLEIHVSSGGCDPKKKKKPTCPVARCKGTLTFSNSSVCKACGVKVCLGHRFPADHTCTARQAAEAAAVGGGRPWNKKFLAAFASRNGKDCGKNEKSGVGGGGGSSVSAKTNSSVKAC